MRCVAVPCGRIITATPHLGILHGVMVLSYQHVVTGDNATLPQGLSPPQYHGRRHGGVVKLNCTPIALLNGGGTVGGTPYINS